MNCRIEAWLEQGAPCVRITDAETGQVCLQWRECREGTGDDGCPCQAEVTLHDLVRGLFLLACMDRVTRPVTGLPAIHPLKRPPRPVATTATPAAASER